MILGGKDDLTAPLVAILSMLAVSCAFKNCAMDMPEQFVDN
jgi:hypothetical protein